MIQFIVTPSDDHENTIQILSKTMSANLIMFEEDSDIYDLTVSDDFLENIDVQLANQRQ